MKLWTNAHSFFILGMASMFQPSSPIILNEQHWGAQRHSKQSRKTFAMKFNFVRHQWKLETKWKCTQQYIRHAFMETYWAVVGSAHFNKKPCYHNATRMAAYQFLKLFGILTLWNCWSQQNVKLTLSQYPQYCPASTTFHPKAVQLWNWE